MSCKTTIYLDSAREIAIQALVHTLDTIPMLRFVSRHDVTVEQVAEPQLPAVLVIEQGTQYAPQSLGPHQTVKVTSSIALDVQGYAGRKCGLAERSAKREELVHAVLMHLYKHPGLRQAEDGPLPVRVQPSLNAKVDYVQVPSPFVRAIIQLELIVEQDVDQRARRSDHQPIVEIESQR